MNWIRQAFRRLTCSHAYRVVIDYDEGNPKILHRTKLHCSLCGHVKLADVVPMGPGPTRPSMEDLDE